jgi:hypothetical protein
MWTKLDKGSHVDKVVMWINWICGQSGYVDKVDMWTKWLSKGSLLESINKRQGSLVKTSFLSILKIYYR